MQEKKVEVKNQKEKRNTETKNNNKDKDKDKKAKKKIQNSVVHIENNEKQSYILNSSSLNEVIKMLIAFLLHNNLLWDKYLIFYVDGERALYNVISTMSSWHSGVNFILDWYHLVKKVKYDLN